MSNHASAAKRDRQRVVQTARNKAVRSRLRHALKTARAAIAAGDAAAAKEPVHAASVLVARAVSKGVLHKKNASRTISRVQTAFAKLA